MKKEQDFYDILCAIHQNIARLNDPSIAFKPELKFHDNLWWAVYGDLYASGLTPIDAMINFDYAFEHAQSPNQN